MRKDRFHVEISKFFSAGDMSRTLLNLDVTSAIVGRRTALESACTYAPAVLAGGTAVVRSGFFVIC